MSDVSGRVAEYVEEQLAGIRKFPLMWGPPIAVELTYLQLLETLFVVHRPDLDVSNPRFIKDQYSAFLDRKYPGLGAGFLSGQLGEERVGELVVALSEFEAEVRAVVTPRNIFEVHDLALGLTLRQGVARPSSTTITVYLETFRRILRGTLAGPGKKGRSKREIEELTEFELPEVSIREANGAPARVVYPLIQRVPEEGTRESTLEREVRDALGHLVAMMDWAASDAGVASLAGTIGEPQRRGILATQALRLVPRGEVEVVELGGALVSRYTPVALRAFARPRLIEALAEDRPTETFEESGEIRALDLDQASFRLKVGGGEVHKCWLLHDPLELLSEWELGARVHVRGRRFAPTIGRKAFVAIDSVELIEEPNQSERP